MKQFVFVLIVFLVALPLSADVIVTGYAGTINPMGQPGVVGWSGINLPIPYNCDPGMRTFDMANAAINLNNGEYFANAEVSGACPISTLTTASVSRIYWESFPMQGEVPVPITISYQDSVAYLSGEWTTMGSVFGYYTWWNGRGISDEDFIDYDFTGPAEFDFLLSGTLADPRLDVQVTFSTDAPSPIPEPSTFLLLGTGLTAICCHKFRW